MLKAGLGRVGRKYKHTCAVIISSTLDLAEMLYSVGENASQSIHLTRESSIGPASIPNSQCRVVMLHTFLSQFTHLNSIL